MTPPAPSPARVALYWDYEDFQRRLPPLSQDDGEPEPALPIEDVTRVLDWADEGGGADIHRALGDWTRCPEAGALLSRRGADLIQWYPPEDGTAEGAAIRLTIAILGDLAPPRLPATVVLVAGGRDYSPLARHLRSLGIRVVGLGPEGADAPPWGAACHAFHHLPQLPSLPFPRSEPLPGSPAGDAPPAEVPEEDQPAPPQEEDSPVASDPAPPKPRPVVTPGMIADLARTMADLPEAPGSPDGPARRDPAPSLSDLARRLELKGRACLWTVERKRLLDQGASYRSEVGPRDEEIIAEGRRAGAYLWMSTPHAPMPEDPEDYHVASACFDNAARAARLLDEAMSSEPLGDLVDEALLCAAEAQSALRLAIKALGWRDVDPEQLALHRYLQQVAESERIYIPRFMRLADPGDPADADDLSRRLGELQATMRGRLDQSRSCEEGIRKISYHLRKLQRGNGDESDWGRVLETLDQMVPATLKSSDIRLRDLLLPMVDELPESVELVPSGGARQVFDALDAYLASRSQPETEEKEASNPEVEKVASRLQGKSMVLLGGEMRPHAREALEEAFRLKELDWLASRVHQSHEPFRAAIMRPAVAVVLLAIRWSSHSFGEIKQFCDDAGVPLVRLPAGYNPSQVARQILRQVPEWDAE